MENSDCSDNKEKSINYQNRNKESNHNLTANNFYELSESISLILISISSKFATYEANLNFWNFQLEMHFEMTKVNIKFLESVLSSLNGEASKSKMLKLYDFISYEFKRLRSKYEEMNETLFNIDEENKYVINIKSLMTKSEIIPSKLACCYLRLVQYYLNKIDKRLKSFQINDFQIEEEDKDKYLFAVNIN